MTEPTFHTADTLFGETTPPEPGRTRKPKLQAAGHSDHFQTPVWAVAPLLPYLNRAWRIWEPACGKGNLVKAFRAEGFSCQGTDVEGNEVDFLTQTVLPWYPFDCIVTNPPYSLKDEFLARCYEIGKPFALLLPFTALEGRTRQSLYRRHGLEVLILPRRVDFETPSGKGSSSWFPVAWFTWGLELGSSLTFAEEIEPR